MTQQTITAFFDKRSDATQAIEQLVTAGIPRNSIQLMPESETSSPSASTGSQYDVKRDEKGFWDSLADFFMPEEDRYTYAEALNRGDIMVSATVDESYAARAEDILEEQGTVNINEREATWRKEGWKGYTATTAPVAPAHKPIGGDETIPVVEEQMKIGKRQVQGGRVKVRSYVVETPVSEQVKLRTESVQVERRPVDRAVAAAEEMFRERTIDAQATSEEAVVSKTARVTGEVLVKKTVEQRNETVSGTVRSTKVDVEDGQASLNTAKTDGLR
jgi:uncharacterized protein (TIGR02271 family)